MGGPHLLRAPVWLGAALLLDIHREWVLKYSVIQYKECRSVILNIQLKHFLYCLKKAYSDFIHSKVYTENKHRYVAGAQVVRPPDRLCD